MWLRLIINIAPTLISIASGILLGLNLTDAPLSNCTKAYICKSGQVFERVIEFLITPYILSNLIIGLNELKLDICRGKIAVRAAVYFTLTSFLAVPMGLLLVVLIQPEVIGENETEDEAPLPFVAVLKDLLRNMVPNDLILGTFQQSKAHYVKFDLETDDQNLTAKSGGMRLVGGPVEGVNILGLVIWFTIIGECLRRLGEESRRLVGLFDSINGFMSHVLESVMGLFPCALLLLTTSYVYEFGLNLDTLIQLRKLTAAVISGLMVYGAVILPLIYFVFVRRNPLVFIKGLGPALLSALCPTEGPLTQKMLYCCEEVNGTDRRITRSTLPVRGHVNTDGTALYQVIATVFIAKVSHTNLHWGQLLTLSVMVAASSSGTRTPGAVPAFIMFFLHVLGVSVRGIWPLMMIHWALDWLSIPVNILGFCVGTGVIEHLSRKDLDEQQEAP